MTAKSVLLYFIRWQLSTPVMWVCLEMLNKLPMLWGVVVSNIVGAAIFIFVDRWIFNKGK